MTVIQSDKMIVTAAQLGVISGISHQWMRPGRCRKCWMMEFGMRVVGCPNQTYTWDTDEGLWAWDIDKAIELTRVGDKQRVDTLLDWQSIHSPDVYRDLDQGHLVCLSRVLVEDDNAKKDAYWTPVVLVTENDSQCGRSGDIIIDGSHRCRIAEMCKVNITATVLSKSESDACLIARGLKGSAQDKLRVVAEYMEKTIVRRLQDQAAQGGTELSVIHEFLGDVNTIGRVEMVKELVQYTGMNLHDATRLVGFEEFGR